MSKSTLRGKRHRKEVQISNVYCALKSQNEIYYQMASIFKHVAANDENKMAKMIFNGFLTGNHSKIFLENSL